MMTFLLFSNLISINLDSKLLGELRLLRSRARITHKNVNHNMKPQNEIQTQMHTKGMLNMSGNAYGNTLTMSACNVQITLSIHLHISQFSRKVSKKVL